MRPCASKLGLVCLAWSGGCIEGVLEGVWERHDVGRIFLRFDFSEFLVETAENRSIFVFRCVSIFFDRFCSNVIGQRDRTRRVKHFCMVICHEHSPKAPIRPSFIPQNRRLHGKSLHCCQAVLGVSNPAGAGSRSGKSARLYHLS